MNNQKFAIRKVNTYVLDFAGESKTVNECVRVGECRLTISDDDLKSLGDLPDPDIEKTYIGNTTILIQNPSGQVIPQRLSFPIVASDMEDAFGKFDEFFSTKVKELQDAERRSSLVEATPGELSAVANSRSSKKTNSGIIMP